MHLDHMTPLARGGADTLENIAVTCARCDFIKGTMTKAEFLHANCGVGRDHPFGTKKGAPKTMRFLKYRMHKMAKDRPESRTLDILRRVFRGEHVNISEYPKYVNPRERTDTLVQKMRKLAREYDFLRFEDGIIWKCK